MKRSILVLFVVILGLAAANQTSGAGTPEITLFDNWNTAACNTTSQAQFSINKEAFVSRIVVWSDTRLGGGNLSGTLSGPQGSMSISSTRGNCDPYQGQWCEQIFAIARPLSAGNYSINLNTNSVCQNSGSRGNGFARVYGQQHSSTTVPLPHQTSGAGTSISAQGITPAYDINGIWGSSSDPGTSIQYYQQGIDVRAIYINRTFSQFVNAKYISPTIIKGTLYRHNRTNGCATNLMYTLNVLSADAISTEWVALDSNCDLRQGQNGSGNAQRDRKLE